MAAAQARRPVRSRGVRSCIARSPHRGDRRRCSRVETVRPSGRDEAHRHNRRRATGTESLLRESARSRRWQRIGRSNPVARCASPRRSGFRLLHMREHLHPRHARVLPEGEPADALPQSLTDAVPPGGDHHVPRQAPKPQARQARSALPRAAAFRLQRHLRLRPLRRAADSIPATRE